MKFYIVKAHYIESQEHIRFAFTNKRDAVRQAKAMCKNADQDEWYHAPKVYRVTTDGSKREVMELVAGSENHGKWVMVWHADWYGGQ